MPSLFDRLINDRAYAPADGLVSHLSLDQLKDAVALDLEALLNTRMVIPVELLARHPDAARSVLDYGLIDFSSFSLANDDDRKAICASLQAAIERHEPRLRDVSATLDAGDDTGKGLNFFISATLRVHAAVEPVNFNALLQPSTRHYSISQIRCAPHLER